MSHARSSGGRRTVTPVDPSSPRAALTAGAATPPGEAPAGLTTPARPLPVPGPVLLGIPLFSRLSAQQLHELTQLSTVRTCARGEVVIHQGGHDNALFVFLGGKALSVRTDGRGREVVLHRIVRGDHAGDLSLIDGKPHSSTVRCEERCLVLVVPGAVLAHCVAQMPELAHAMTLALVTRLRFSHRRISSLALDETKDRVAQWLVEMSTELEGRSVVCEKISRQVLGRTVGASREMVSRVMTDMAAQDLIETLPNGFTLLKFKHPG